MSGVYLTVWDFEHSGLESPILRPTSGGWPHITLAYTGKAVEREALAALAAHILPFYAREEIHITEAYVNSFVVERTGEERHDVLMRLHPDDVSRIENTRGRGIRGRSDAAAFTMREPHITHACFKDRAEAFACCAALQAHLPATVVVTGVAI